MIELYPVKYEATQDGDLVFTAEMFDECTALVNIKRCVTLAEWQEIKELVEEAIVDMKLTTGQEF